MLYAMPPAAGQPAALQGVRVNPLSTSARLELPAPQQRVREKEGERERVDAHRNPVGESVCLSVGVCEGGGVRPPPRERVSRAVAEGRRAECVCEAETELESVYMCIYMCVYIYIYIYT